MHVDTATSLQNFVVQSAKVERASVVHPTSTSPAEAAIMTAYAETVVCFETQTVQEEMPL